MEWSKRKKYLLLGWCDDWTGGVVGEGDDVEDATREEFDLVYFFTYETNSMSVRPKLWILDNHMSL